MLSESHTESQNVAAKSRCARRTLGARRCVCVCNKSGRCRHRCARQGAASVFRLDKLFFESVPRRRQPSPPPPRQCALVSFILGGAQNAAAHTEISNERTVVYVCRVHFRPTQCENKASLIQFNWLHLTLCVRNDANKLLKRST